MIDFYFSRHKHQMLLFFYVYFMSKSDIRPIESTDNRCLIKKTPQITGAFNSRLKAI